MKAKKIILGSTLTLVLASSGLFIYLRHKQKIAQSEKTVEQIFKERSDLSKTYLTNPLAQFILTKNWDALSTQYQPEKQSALLSNIIRAIFIQNRMAEFSPKDQERLLELLLKSFEANPSKPSHEMGLMLTQMERLLPPPPGSPSEKKLMSYLSGENQDLRILAIRKLVAQELNPRPEAIQALVKLTKGGSQHISSSEIITLIDEMRNTTKKGEVLKHLLSGFDQLPSDMKPLTLVIFSRNMKLNPDSLKKVRAILGQYLKASKILENECALRSILPLNDFKPFTPEEKGKIVNLLTAIPEANRTPFVRAKSEEIIKIFQPSI